MRNFASRCLKCARKTGIAIVMSVKLVSVDFWNTLVSAKSNGPLRHRARVDGLMEHGKTARASLTETQVEDALKAVSAHFDRIWLSSARTLAPAELVDALEQELRLIFSDRAAVQRVLQQSVLAGPPEWAPGAVENLKELSKTVKLAVISDTMYSTGAVLRKLFESAGIEEVIQTFVFSDEMGWSKPDRRSFLHALEKSGVAADEAVHIGDMQATDIHGAQSVGMKAVLFTGLNGKDRATTSANAVLDHWDDLNQVLAKLS